MSIYQYPSLDEVKQAYAQGNIDVMFSTSNEVIDLANKGQKPKIVLVADYSNGADAIVAKPGIHSIKDLRGKKIAVEVGTISHFLLLRALQTAGLKEQDVTLINIDPSQTAAQFQNSSVAAVTTWSKYTQDAVRIGGKVIFSSKEIPGEIIDTMSIRDDLLTKRPAECEKIIVAYLKTLDWFKQNQKEGMAILAKSANIDIGQVESSLQGIKLTGLQENISAFGTTTNPGSIYPATQKFINFLLAEKLIDKKLQATALIDPNFIRKTIPVLDQFST